MASAQTSQAWIPNGAKAEERTRCNEAVGMARPTTASSVPHIQFGRALLVVSSFLMERRGGFREDAGSIQAGFRKDHEGFT